MAFFWWENTAVPSNRKRFTPAAGSRRSQIGRKMPTLKGRAGIADFLRNNIGKTVTTEQIYAASGNQGQYGRRLRELRNDFGWKISSHNDRADLQPGEYRPEEAPPETSEYKFNKAISGRLRAQVLERNGYTCQMCGVGAGDEMVDGRKARLHIGHIIDRSHGGEDMLNNLRALCSECNQGAKNIVQEPPTYTWLISQVRRAKENDQRAVFEWLAKKFGAIYDSL